MLSAKNFRVAGAVIGALMLALPQAWAQAQAQAMRGEASVTTSGGHGRIVIRTSAEIESQVRMTGGILVIQFRQPVDIPVDRLGSAASEYIGAARRDPDGRALRFALAQKVRLSSMTAGDRLFVDLLPESWTGNSPEFREVARIVASGDTLSGFLRDLKARYPEMQGVTPDAAAAPAGVAPKASKADPEPTGSIREKTSRRISAR